jgi:hypothetical protein
MPAQQNIQVFLLQSQQKEKGSGQWFVTEIKETKKLQRIEGMHCIFIIRFVAPKKYRVCQLEIIHSDMSHRFINHARAITETDKNQITNVFYRTKTLLLTCYTVKQCPKSYWYFSCSPLLINLIVDWTHRSLVHLATLDLT